MYPQMLFSSKKLKWNFTLHRLSEMPHYMDQVTDWVKQSWGQLEHLDYLISDIKLYQDEFYIVTYGDLMIGMFGLFKKPYFDKALVVQEFDYFFIHPNFRNLGAGRTIVEMVKSLSRQQGADMIILETLNPSINHFYEKLGAKAVCDNSKFQKASERDTGIEYTCMRI